MFHRDCLYLYPSYVTFMATKPLLSRVKEYAQQWRKEWQWPGFFDHYSLSVYNSDSSVNVMISYRLVLKSQQGQKFVSLPQLIDRLKAPLSVLFNNYGGNFLGITQLRRDFYHSHSCSAEIKNTWNFDLHPTYHFKCNDFVLKHRSKFWCQLIDQYMN
jgi:hypothetical protein